MKKIMLFLLVATFSTAMMKASDNKKRASELSENMVKVLGINTDQKKKMYDMLLAKFDKLEKYNKADLTKNEKVEMMVEKRTYIMDVRAILTEEQYTKWQTVRTTQVKALNQGQHVDQLVVDKTIETWQF